MDRRGQNKFLLQTEDYDDDIHLEDLLANFESDEDVEKVESRKVDQIDSEYGNITKRKVELEISTDDEDEDKKKTNVFRPLVTSPKFDFEVELEKNINIVRKLYGVEESTNFAEEYEIYSSNYLNENGVSTELTKSPEFEQTRKMSTRKGKQKENTLDFQGACNSVNSNKNTNCLETFTTEGTVRQKLSSRRKIQKLPDGKKFSETDLLKYHQVRKAEKDEYVLETTFDFVKPVNCLSEDEWEDIRDPMVDVWIRETASAVGIVRTDAEVQTMSAAVKIDDHQQKIKARAEKIVKSHLANAVQRKISQKRKILDDGIPIRTSGFVRSCPSSSQKVKIRGAGCDLVSRHELQKQNQLPNILDNPNQLEENELANEEPRNAATNLCLLFTDHELDEALETDRLADKMEQCAMSLESVEEELEKPPEDMTTTMIVPTREFYTEKEFMELKQELLDSTGIKESLESESKSNNQSIKLGKFKVRKYKFVTTKNMIEDFIRITYPTMRQRRNRMLAVHGKFRARPMPKHHTTFLNGEILFKNLICPLACKLMQIPSFQAYKIMDEISPAIGKTYHDVQYERSMIAGRPPQILPASFPASYCKDSRTLSYLSDCLFEFSKEDKGNSQQIGAMIQSCPQMTMPNSTSESYSISPGSRLAHKAMDMVFTVVIFHPVKFTGDVRTALLREKDTVHLKMSSKVELLGSQSFGNIRNMFVCHSDGYNTEETTEMPEKMTPIPRKQCNKNVRPTSAFLVGNTILVDYNEDESVILATNIRSWYENSTEHSRKIEIYDSVGTTVSDLTISFGEPYVFIHQVNCQHIFQFKNSRVSLPGEDLSSSLFPRYLYKNNSLLLCCIDKKFPARWSVYGFELLPEISMLLCTKCVKAFCFNKDGKKRGDFRLYQFNQPN